MQIQRNVDLLRLNTLGVPSVAEYLLQVNTVSDIHSARAWASRELCGIQVIGGGSNIVLGPNVLGLTLHMKIQGREIIASNAKRAIVRVGAGENWHEFVSWSLANHLYGLENLALIPGSVGASPVQNIGAYGVEVGLFIERVEGIDLATGDDFALAAQDCCFDYRDSIFKRDSSRRWIITHVSFSLPTAANLNIDYPALAAEVAGEQLTPQRVFDAVCRIRSSKLPDPAFIPNCGSFFKNPVVSETAFRRLLAAHPNLPSYSIATPTASAYRKIAAAWLIDQCAWKGLSRYGVSVHSEQALVLTNGNYCDGRAVLALAHDIQSHVRERFAVELEMEPRLLGAW